MNKKQEAVMKERWFYHWHAQREMKKFIPWVARKLPNKVKYFVVIHGMVSVTPNGDPTLVIGMELLDLWEPPSDK